MNKGAYENAFQNEFRCWTSCCKTETIFIQWYVDSQSWESFVGPKWSSLELVMSVERYEPPLSADWNNRVSWCSELSQPWSISYLLCTEKKVHSLEKCKLSRVNELHELFHSRMSYSKTKLSAFVGDAVQLVSRWAVSGEAPARNGIGGG